MFSNELFQFSYKILNVPSEKIMLLWNFCEFFLGIISWKGASLFNGGLVLLSWRGLYFRGGIPPCSPPRPSSPPTTTTHYYEKP